MTARALSPRVRQILDKIPPGVPPHLDIDGERAYLHALSDVLFFRYTESGPEVHSVEEHLLPVAAGESIRVRLYRPPVDTPLAAHVSLHGGGWKLGSIDERVNDAICRQRCVGAGVIVVAVEYRLAPEHKFPIPMDDCWAAVRWLFEHADALGVDPTNLSIGGVSAGGNLAAAVALRARDSGGPALRFQLLEVPALDLTRRIARETLAAGVLPPGVPQPTMEDAIEVYLRSPEDGGLPMASPLFAEDLSGLPPTFVMTAEFDMLRTEGEQYAERLRRAGVPVTDRRYAGALHGTSTWTRAWEPAAQWQADVVRALREAHGTTGEPRSDQRVSVD